MDASELEVQTQNPILRLGSAFSPECSAFAFLALAISASIIACVTIHRSGFGSGIAECKLRHTSDPSCDHVSHFRHKIAQKLRGFCVVLVYSKRLFSAAMLSSSPIHKPRPLLDGSTFALWASLLVVFLFGSLVQAAPIVSNLTAAQRAGTRLVDLTYDLDVASLVKITVEISSDGGQTYFVPAYALTGDVGLDVSAGNGKAITWDAGADWLGNFSDQMRFRIVADDLTDGFSYIPEGPFTMGVTSGDTDVSAPPVNVFISRFVVSTKEITKSEWDSVRSWASSRGYSDLPSGENAFKLGSTPVHNVGWWGAIKWCNARSEKEGLTPVYKENSGPLRAGTNLTQVNWSAGGYRLPTEAEWEKLARGGAKNQRFPWNSDIVRHSNGNYNSSSAYFYDVSPTRGYHPLYSGNEYPLGGSPYIAPVGSFQSNGYGVYDVCGNISEWCWDWFESTQYANIGGSVNPTGPASPTSAGRVIRGGNWDSSAANIRLSARAYRSPSAPLNENRHGFRVVKLSDEVKTDSLASKVDSRHGQIIVFAPISDKLTTDSINLTATGGGSGNAVTFAVTSGPGVITNNVLTFTTSGNVTITASQAGNYNYLAAEDVVRTFTVTKATSTIQFADLLQVDDGSERLVSFTTDPADLPYDLLYAGSESAPSLPGSYAVTASLDHPIHSGSGSATLTILGLSGRGQRLTSGSSQPQEANGTDFGPGGPGHVATQTFTITNPGTTPVALTGSPRVEIIGDHAGDFQISAPPAAEIPAGGSVSFEVRFAPTQPGRVGRW
jgi:formylglycine-generating enzyme